MSERDDSFEVQLSRRERQIMDLVFAHGEATAREIWDKLPDPPGYSTVRKLLSVLIDKGELATTQNGRALVYHPLRSKQAVTRSALTRLVDTFFGGSVEKAVSGLLDLGEKDLSESEAQRLLERIEQAQLSEEGDHEPTART